MKRDELIYQFRDIVNEHDALEALINEQKKQIQEQEADIKRMRQVLAEAPARSPAPTGMEAAAAFDFIAAVYEGIHLIINLRHADMFALKAGSLHELIISCLEQCEPQVRAYMLHELSRIEEGYYGRPPV